MPTKVQRDERLTMPPAPTPPQEQPVEASAEAERYAVLHALVDRYHYLDIVERDDLGDAAARERLLALGAIAPVEHAITRLAILGESQAAETLRRKLRT